MKRTILVADVPESHSRYRAILGEGELVFVTGLGEAVRRVDAIRYDAILIGVLVDDSRMFDLLRHLRAAPGSSKDTPVACVRSGGTLAISARALEIAAKALRCDCFIDFAAHADDAAGNEAVRRIVYDLMEGKTTT